ncbi:MAG: S41 family peptidase [Solobacterium sp.]|nr:S41 family peptidase [Solobacterium sp.]
MSEEKNRQDDEVIRVQLERHQWPDEIDLKTLKKENRRLMRIIYILAIICGLLVGLAWSLRGRKPVTNTADTKLSEILRIMSKEWFFAKDIEDPEGRLMDQALIGMTTNAEDPHTVYMTEEETTNFTQSINRNFVGIGVQYFSTGDGIHMVERVFKGSPAEKAGVQPGDMIHIVDGTVVDDLTSDDITGMVRGEPGTSVEIVFIRGDELVTLVIPRQAINVTVFGEMLDNSIGYIEIMQFGETTAAEMKTYMQDLLDQGAKSLIIDLRGNGGGYLDSLQDVASLFIPKGQTLMKQVYPNDSEEVLLAKSGQIWNDGDIVLLVDENTASASEVFTLAMKENRDDVTVIGSKTYGKGTVQITYTFSDRSALKYTTSKWVSPNGIWVNNQGIEPDIPVDLHPALTTIFIDMDEQTVLSYDSVSEYNRIAQLAMDFLGYSAGRVDGYFSKGMEDAIRKFQDDRGLEVNGTLDKDTYNSLLSAVIYTWNTDHSYDAPLVKAKEILHG